MSVAAMTWAGRQQIASGSIKGVLTAVAWIAGKEGTARPAQSTIADRAGLSPRSVWEALAILEKLGVISRERRSRARLGRTSDLITLRLHRDFNISKKDIAEARKALKFERSNSQSLREAENLQLAKSAPATRNLCEGYYSDTTDPYQVEVNAEVEGYSSASGKAKLTDGEAYPTNVIPLMSRGAA
jgi:Mn-dependent DtxR family transcriptional regulator